MSSLFLSGSRHSKPALASRTASLKRLSDSSSPVQITTLSRSRRALALRLTRPSSTMQPAIVPTFATLKTWRISTSPHTCSRCSGAHVGADDGRLGRHCEGHVALGDAADLRVPHLHLDFVGGELVQGMHQR